MSIDDLPNKLLSEVFHQLSRSGLRTVRLVDHRACGTATPILFNDVYFSLTPQSWKNLKSISECLHLARLLHVLHFDAKILPRYQTQISWEESIDTRPFAGEFFVAQDREQGDSITTVEDWKKCERVTRRRTRLC
jgi:hypothetical protein